MPKINPLLHAIDNDDADTMCRIMDKWLDRIDLQQQKVNLGELFSKRHKNFPLCSEHVPLDIPTIPRLATDNKPSCLKLLIEKYHLSANFSVQHPLYNFSLLYLATTTNSLECMKVILDNHGDPNAKSRTGTTPFMAAMSRSNIMFAKMLIQNGANPHIQTNDGNNATTYAIGHDDVTLLNFLADLQVNTNLEDHSGTTPMMKAIIYSKEQSTKWLIDHNTYFGTMTKDGNTLLGMSATNHPELVQFFLKQGLSSKINIHSGEGNVTPLSLALIGGNPDCIRMLLEDHVNRQGINLSQNKLKEVTDNLLALLQQNPQINSAADNRLEPMIDHELKVAMMDKSLNTASRVPAISF